MPVVAANLDETEKFDLETAKPDGYVVLRRFTYGEIIKRRSLTKMSMNIGQGKNKDKNRDLQGEMALASTDINAYDFANAIVSHNLERAVGVPYNFKNPVELQYLDPRVGEEIETLISKMNDFTEEVGE